MCECNDYTVSRRSFLKKATMGLGALAIADPLLGLAGVVIVSWRYRSRGGAAVLAMLGYFVGMLLPVLGLINMAYHQFSFVADHLQYVALAGPVALAIGAATILTRRWFSGWRAAVPSLVLLAVLSGLTSTALVTGAVSTVVTG